MEATQKYYYHKIPSASTISTTKKQNLPQSEPWFIGIIDSSGSMCSWWKHVAKNYNELIDNLSTPENKIITYCFDSSIHPVPNNKLSDSIYDHGGSMTNIFAAMQRLDNELKKIPINEEVRVCFVSDGQDTCNSNLENRLRTLRGRMGGRLTFMCVGIQSGFPTKVSMFLREKYHRGDSSVPSIFLIEYASDKAFFNKFQSLKPFISVKHNLKVDPPQRLFPWEAPFAEVPEDIWIMSQQESITLNGETVLTYRDEDFSVNAMMEVFRSWSQKLQLDSLNKKITFAQAQEYACSCHGLMMNLIEDVKKSRGLDILTGKVSADNTFLARVLNLQISRTSMRIKGFLDAVEEIKNGRDLGALNEYEAAKIIGLGTIVGKAQQRALALKNMNTEKLTQYVDEFVNAYNSIEVQGETGFPNSLISDINFRDIVADSTLESGLRKFHSPLDYLDIFPLFGYGINVKRNDGCELNANKLSVKSYSNKFVDSSTFDFNIHKLIHGNEEYNCVCPLIPKKDAYLAPLYNSNLIRYLISYNTTEQLDHIVPQSWLVLLSDLFILAFQKKDNDTIELILDTIDAMKDFDPWKQIIEGIEVNDSSVYSLLTRRSSFLLAHYYMIKRSPDIDEDEVDEVIQKMWVFYFQSRLKTTQIREFVDSEATHGLKKAMNEKYSEEYLLTKFFTRGEVVRHIKTHIIKEMNEISADLSAGNIKLVPGGFTADTNMPISFKIMKKLTKKIKGAATLDDETTFQILAHCVQNKENSVETPVDITVEEAKHLLSKNFQSSSGAEVKKRIKGQLLDSLQKKYIKAFKKSHWNTLPKKWEQVIEACKQKGIDWDKIEWKPQMGLAKNACMSDNCPHQFVPKGPGRLRSHLGGWQGLLPRGFHAYVNQNKDKSADAIYNGFSGRIRDISAYGVTKEKVLEYIENIKAVI